MNDTAYSPTDVHKKFVRLAKKILEAMEIPTIVHLGKVFFFKDSWGVLRHGYSDTGHWFADQRFAGITEYEEVKEFSDWLFQPVTHYGYTLRSHNTTRLNYEVETARDLCYYYLQPLFDLQMREDGILEVHQSIGDWLMHFYASSTETSSCILTLEDKTKRPHEWDTIEVWRGGEPCVITNIKDLEI